MQNMQGKIGLSQAKSWKYINLNTYFLISFQQTDDIYSKNIAENISLTQQRSVCECVYVLALNYPLFI